MANTDRAVGDGCDGGLAVRFERSGGFIQSAVLGSALVVQCDVMRRGLAGADRKSFGLGFADGVEGDRGADVPAHVHAGFAGHVNVAFDD